MADKLRTMFKTFIQKQITKALILFSVLAFASPLSAAQNTASESPWYESILEEGKALSISVYDWCAAALESGMTLVSEMGSKLKDSTQVLDNAENTLKERSTAATNRMNDIQQKTQLKGESTNFNKVMDNENLNFETKNVGDL